MRPPLTACNSLINQRLRPIIDAHFYESHLQWIGIMLTPSVLERRAEITNDSCAFGAAFGDTDPRGGAITALATLMIQPCLSIPGASQGRFRRQLHIAA